MKADENKMPQNIRPFEFLGCDMSEQEGGGDWIGTCRLCGKEDHLYVEPETGKWDCKVCGEHGNVITFMTKLAKSLFKKTTRKDWVRLSRKRELPSGVLKARGLCWDPVLNAWLIPSWSANGTAHQLGVWHEKGGNTINVAGVPAALFGADRLAKLKRGSRVWLGEGWSDACAIDTLARDGGLDCDAAVGLPGATTFKKEWAKLFDGMHVVCAFDADEAGDKGELRAVKVLSGHAQSQSFVRWPEIAPKGFDTRDLYRAAEDAEEAADEIESLVRNEPRRALSENGKYKAQQNAGEGTIEDVGTAELDEVIEVFRESMQMNADMVDVLKVCLATVLSADISGDPLWVYVVGPPSSGKTAMLAPLQGSNRCIFRSTLTQHNLVSGFRLEGGADPSLLPKLSGRAFVLKDFTEVLALPLPAQDEIFSTLRGAYDGHVVRTFGNGVERRYTSQSDPPFKPFSLLAGVTNAIHAHGKANLGERFLKVQFNDHTAEEQALINMMALSSLGKETQKEEKLQRVVAAFLNRELDGPDDLPSWPKDLVKRMNATVTLIATLRAQVDRDRFTSDILYRPKPEAGARLMKQLGKLGCMLAWMEGRDEVSKEDYRIVDRVAMDTAYGFHLDVIDAIVKMDGEATKSEIADIAKLPASTLTRRVDDLILLGAVYRKGDKLTSGRTAATFAVTDHIKQLWIMSRGGTPWDSETQTKRKTVKSAQSKPQKRHKVRLVRKKR